MKKYVGFAVLIILVVFFAIKAISFDKKGGMSRENIQNQQNKYQKMKIGSTEISIEVLNTDEERMKGLSGRQSLEEGVGLLFDFKQEGYYGIWMKDMNFPIDIAWLDKDKKIIHIEKNVSPDTYPKVFYSFKDGVQSPSLYVLETNANFFENAKIKIGDRAEF